MSKIHFVNENADISTQINILTPTISVIIPMYNAEKYIEQCLTNLLIQTFQNFEVIVVDDQSTDNSFALAKKFLPKFNRKLKVLQMEQNSGSPGEPRNFGIQYSKGKYIYFLDSDDMLIPTALEELYSFTDDEDIDLIHSEKSFVPMVKSKDGGFDATEIIDDTTVFKIFDSGNCDKPMFETNDITERILRFSQKNFWTTVWRNLFRRDLIINNHLQFIDTKILEDDVFTFQCLCRAKKILHIPNIFYIYRMRQNSISHSSSTRKYKERIAITIKIFKVLDDFMSSEKIFVDDAELKYHVFNFFIQKLTSPMNNMAPYDLDEILRENLSSMSNENIALTAYSFSMMNYFRHAYLRSKNQ